MSKNADKEKDCESQVMNDKGKDEEDDDQDWISIASSENFGTPWTTKDISFVGNYAKEPPVINTVKKSISKLDVSSDTLDGRFGWFIVFIIFIINAFVSGTTFTLGVSIPPLWKHFEVRESKAVLVGSVMILAIMSAGPIVGLLITKYGCRPVMMIGGVINFIGAFACTYSQDIPTMIALFGFVGGIGLGFLYISAFIILGYYFRNRIALASGIAMCGTSVGTFAFNPLREYLQETLGWNNATIIFGAFGLLCSLLSTLLPLPAPDLDIFSKMWIRISAKPIITNEKEHKVKNRKPDEETNDFKSKLKAICRKISKSSMLKNKLLWLFWLSSAFTMMGFSVPLVYMKKDGQNKGIEPSKAVFLLSIIALFDGLGRILLGIFCQKTGISPLKIKTFWIAVASVSCFVVPLFEKFLPLAILSGFIGLGYGSYIAMIMPIFVSLVKKQHIPGAVGIENLFSGIAIALGAPIAGEFLSVSKNLHISFIFGGSSLAGAVVVNFIIMCRIHFSPNDLSVRV